MEWFQWYPPAPPSWLLAGVLAATVLVVLSAAARSCRIIWTDQPHDRTNGRVPAGERG